MYKYVALATLTLLSSSLKAENLIVDATVEKIGSTNWNERAFYLVLSGGSGPCLGKNISFPEEFSQSTVAYAQAHSMAVTALVHNKKVRIHNYGNRSYKNDDPCTGATLIEISK